MFEKINTYYLSEWDTLPFDKQFHFASRKWLWSQDPAMAQKLEESKLEFCRSGSLEDIQAVLAEILAAQSPEFGSKNATAERAPYFAKYPLLRQLLPLLFRLLFIETVYGIDGRAALPKVIDLSGAPKLADDLMQDDRALAILSTHACNFLYLWHRFYLKQEDGFEVSKLLEVGQNAYDLNDKTELQLYIYLYTHCIIGESLFYKRQLPAVNLPIYQQMSSELSKVLTERFEDVNLDNKYETLVTQLICGQTPELLEQVDQEALQSYANDGDFVVDRHNNNAQTDNITLDKSEHRNVLLLLAHLPFTPTNQVIG